MSKTENLESLNKISSTVSERDKRIWENEAHSICIKKAAEELDHEIKRMEKASEDLRKENAVLEKRLTEVTESVDVQKQTLKTCERSFLVHKSLKENLIQQRDEMRKKYEKVLQMYEDEYQEHRAIYINNSKGYKDLRDKEIRLKKLKIARMELEVKINDLMNVRKQFREIQSQIMRANIVKFARFYCLYHKNERVQAQLKEKKDEEKQLMKQHLELVKQVKEKQQAKEVKERKQRQILNSAIGADEKPEEKIQSAKENKDVTYDKLRKFLQEETKIFSLTSLDSGSQQSHFNKDSSKVRLLDMKVVKVPSFAQQAVKKPDLELRKKMETIMETTRKGALRASSTHVTPTGSQQSQNEKLSQKSQEKPPTPKDNIQINPILKQKKEELVQTQHTEKTVTTKDENTSKFFNTKKKSVTFQNESILKTSQEDKQVRETENKFTFQSDNKENDNENPPKGFPFRIAQDNVKPVELNPMDIFRKPFTFSDTIARQEKKRSDSFVRTSSFGMFSKKLSGEKMPDPTPETGTTGNISSSVGFTGPESSDKQTSDESSAFDPFESSFNRNDFVQTPLNMTEEFGQPAESNTFNFFGAQNKNNLFNMF